MYFSRVEIDRYNRKKLRELNHLGAYHSWVENSFPDERNKEKKYRSRKLWRVDSVSNKLYLLILSSTKPDKEKLEKYGVKGSAQIKDYDKFLNKLEEGMKARFKIKLNTVKSYSNGRNNKKRGRVAPVAINKLSEFFIDRTEKNGFKVNENEFDISQRTRELFIKKNKNNKTKINLVGAVFEGILEIKDIDIFKKTLTRGIGKKKAYGFGLLTIIPYYD